MTSDNRSGGYSGGSGKRGRPMRLEIATRKRKQHQNGGSILKNGSSSKSSSPSVVAMSCSTAATTATTPMRLDSLGSPCMPQSPPVAAALKQLHHHHHQQQQQQHRHHFDLVPIVDEEDEDSDVDMMYYGDDLDSDSDDQYVDAEDEARSSSVFHSFSGADTVDMVDVMVDSSHHHHHDEQNDDTVQWDDVLHQADILTCVFFFMNRRELLTRVRLVCKQWSEVCTGSTLLWHHHTFKDNPYYYYSTSRRSAVDDSDSAMVDVEEEEEDSAEPGDNNDDDDSAQSQQQLKRRRRRIEVSSDAQMYPVDKLMWHDHGDSVSMSRRKLQGTWTFLNYKEYFIEQCLLERCSITSSANGAASGDSSASTAGNSSQGSGADVSMQDARASSKSHHGKDKLGPMFLEDKHTMSIIDKTPPPPTYRHSLTVLPCTPQSETVKYRGISRDRFNTHYDSENAIYKRKYSDRTVVDPMNPSDKVYFIGGLHNTMTTQPPELAEDFINVLEMVDSSNQRRGSISTSNTPTSSVPSSPSASTTSSVSSPLAQGLRRLLNFGNGSGSGCINFGHSSPALKKMSPFKRIQVMGKPPHIGKHTSVLFDDVEINGRHGPKILIFGGVENDQVTNNLYHFDLNTNTWFLEQFGQSELVPSARTNHAAVAVGDYMYIVGGGIGSNMVPTSEIWRYHVHLHHWEQVAFTGDVDAFTPRLGVVLCAINHKILIYGGGYWHQTSMVDRYWREKYRDLYILDTDTNVLTIIDQGNNSIAPQVGTFPASVLVGTQWFIVGGAFDNKISYDVFAFDTVTYRWRKFNQTFYGGDSLSCCHFVTNDQLNKLLILGGYCYSPLNNFQVFSLRYKDLMDAKHIFPTTVFHFHSDELEQQR